MNIARIAAAAALLNAARCLDTTGDPSEIRSWKKHDCRTAPGAKHYILQFESYPDADIRADLAGRGIRILQYVPDNALMVSSAATADPERPSLVSRGFTRYFG